MKSHGKVIVQLTSRYILLAYNVHQHSRCVYTWLKKKDP